jgi:hypothetical protein
MKFKFTDEYVAPRTLEEAVQRLPLEMRLAGSTASEIVEYCTPGEILKALCTEEVLKTLTIEELKKLKKIVNELYSIS